MTLPGRTKNVPNSLFDKMLQYPKTATYLSALLGLAARSEDFVRSGTITITDAIYHLTSAYEVLTS